MRTIGVRTDAEGRIRGVLQPGRYRLALDWQIRPGTLVGPTTPDIATLAPFELTEATFTFTTGALAAKVLNPEGRPARAHQAGRNEPRAFKEGARL